MKTNHDFPVELQPVFTLNPVRIEDGGSGDDIRNHKAVVRQDNGKVLGIVSDKYQLLRHTEVVDAFRQILSDKEYEEKIKVAKEGAHLFATYKMPSVQIEVVKGDIVSLQFVVKNSYEWLTLRTGYARRISSSV